jgi:hypothetical protein
MRIAIARGLLFRVILLLPAAATAQFSEKKVLTLDRQAQRLASWVLSQSILDRLHL